MYGFQRNALVKQVYSYIAKTSYAHSPIKLRVYNANTHSSERNKIYLTWTLSNILQKIIDT